MAFKMRTSKPGAGNKYYIRKAQGGYSNAIYGSPTDKECNVLANCVGYAYGRFNEIGGYGYCKYLAPVNAENFMDYKGSCQTGMTPKVGAVMVWEGKGSLAGHVAIVERVDSATQVLTSESGYGSSAFWNQTRKKGSGNWGCGSNYVFKGFIYNPAVKDEPVNTDPFPGVSDEELARRVWNGEFGNGDARRNALGSRYDAVQRLVDQGVGKPEAKPVEPPKPVLKSNEEIAKEVIDGKWGNYPERKTRLEAAGYNYAEVQALVNKMVAKPATPTFNIGDKVIITGNYASSSKSKSAPHNKMKGAVRYIVNIYEGTNYPYQLGAKKGNTSSENTTGFAKASSIKKA